MVKSFWQTAGTALSVTGLALALTVASAPKTASAAVTFYGTFSTSGGSISCASGCQFTTIPGVGLSVSTGNGGGYLVTFDGEIFGDG